MPEAADTHEHEPLHNGDTESGATPELDLATLAPAEIGRLVNLRERVTSGAVNEWTADYRRLRFARWLYQQGALQS